MFWKTKRWTSGIYIVLRTFIRQRTGNSLLDWLNEWHVRNRKWRRPRLYHRKVVMWNCENKEWVGVNSEFEENQVKVRGAKPADRIGKVGHRYVDRAKKSDYLKVSGLDRIHREEDWTIVEQKYRDWRSHWDVQRLAWGVQGSKPWSNLRKLPRAISRFWTK